MPMKNEEEISSFGKKYIFRLHERVQTKYNEMQKKLEKSRSVDSLSVVSDDFSYKELCEFNREMDEVAKSEADIEYSLKQEYHTAKIMEQKAVSQIMEHTPLAMETEFTFQNEKAIEDDWENLSNNLSLESLSDIGREIDENQVPTTPPFRSIRSRIESKLKERRERKKQERERRLKAKSMESCDFVEKLVLSNSAKDIIRIAKKNKIATLTIALIEATGLDVTTEDRMHFTFCRFRLGTEKCKSKVIKSNDAAVKWLELYNMTMYDDRSLLEIVLWDKETTWLTGRTVVDLSGLAKEQTHKLKLDLEGDIAGVKLLVLLTISGISLMNTVTEVDDVKNAKLQLDRRKQAWYRLDNRVSDVGWLSVIVYGAKGLVGQDCYCVLKLVNERVQTHTEYKTNDPNWMKIFTFQISDITSVFEVSVVDEKKVEEIGKISVPLLRINNGAKVWYALKDHSQRERAKGNNPRILLEMRTSWNLKSAAIRIINPKEVDLLAATPKFDRRVFARDIGRAKVVTNWTLDSLKLIKTCFEWESRKSNIIALIAWILFCYFFRIWMLPLLFLIPFVRYRPSKYKLINWNNSNGELEMVKAEKEEKSTLRKKLSNLQELVQSVQNGIGKVASLGESIKNLYNFTVPFVSLLAIVLVLLISFVMYIIPLKYILICWGIHKLTRKILRPNRIPNSEILDLLSRVPDDERLLDCEELALDNITEDVI